MTTERYSDEYFVYVNYSAPVEVDGWYVLLDKGRVSKMKASTEDILLKLQGSIEVGGSSGWSLVPGLPPRRQITCSPSGNISASIQAQLFRLCPGGRTMKEGDGNCGWNTLSVLASSSDDSRCRWIDYLELTTANMLALTTMLAAAGSAWGHFAVRPLLHFSAVCAAVSGWVMFAGLTGGLESALGSPQALHPFLSLLLFFPGPLVPAAYALEAGFIVASVALIALLSIHSSHGATTAHGFAGICLRE